MALAQGLASVAAAEAPPAPIEKAPGAFRVALFNVKLARGRAGALIDELRALQAPADTAASPRSRQLRSLVEILRAVRPDALVLQEIDYDPAGEALDLFERALAEVDAAGAPLAYAHRFQAPVNTGLRTGLDLDGDGRVSGPGDAQGWGVFEGQFGMAVLSQAPIGPRRTFQTLLWRAAPDAAPPRRRDGRPFYSAEAWAQLRLSSKSHWDVALAPEDAAAALHLLISHPTPPVFDGPEDRNGRRNAAEIRFWRDYLTPGAAVWIRDDAGRAGGLPPEAAFVILGDLNADPYDGDGDQGAIADLLGHPRVVDARPESAGGRIAAARQGGVNARHVGAAAEDTADFRDAPPRGPGNLRVDYALPARGLAIASAGVYWPAPGAPGAEAAARASDHRLVWIDLRLD